MTDRLPAALSGVELGGGFFLDGDDEFRKEEAARALANLHLEPGTRDFNFDHLRGSEVELETLASRLATPPMMAEWRVVLLRETEALARSSKARELLVDAVREPPPGLACILVASTGGSGARFYKDLKRHAATLDFDPISENDVPGWLLERAEQRHGLEMEEEAARALGAAVGTNLGVLAQELDKLASLVGEEGPIRLADVEAAGTRLPEQDRWRWFDLVGERNFAEAVDGLGTLLRQQGESGVGLTIGLGRHLLRIGAAAEGGRQAVEQLLPGRLRGWLAPKLASQARGWSVADVEEALTGLRRVDRLLKSSSFAEEHLLEEWLLERMAIAADRGGEAA